jgi:hypothetical protein
MGRAVAADVALTASRKEIPMSVRRCAVSAAFAGALGFVAWTAAHSEPLKTDGLRPFRTADCPGYCEKSSPDDVEKCTNRCVKRIKRMRASWPDRCWRLCPPDRRRPSGKSRGLDHQADDLVKRKRRYQ